MHSEGQNQSESSTRNSPFPLVLRWVFSERYSALLTGSALHIYWQLKSSRYSLGKKWSKVLFLPLFQSAMHLVSCWGEGEYNGWGEWRPSSSFVFFSETTVGLWYNVPRYWIMVHNCDTLEKGERVEFWFCEYTWIFDRTIRYFTLPICCPTSTFLN